MFTTEKGLEVGAAFSRFLSKRRRRQKRKQVVLGVQDTSKEQQRFEYNLHFVGLHVPRNEHVILER